MALNDLLVYVNESERTDLRVEAAVALAMDHDAHLTGLGVRMSAETPTYALAAIPPDVLVEVERRETASMATAQKMFESIVKHAGWSDRSSWIEEAGGIVDTVSRNARFADLTIIGQQPAQESMDAYLDLPDDFVLHSGRPVLVIPEIGVSRPIGKRVAVAWNGGREASRAVADAMPILERAEAVEVLSIEPKGMGDLPGADLAQHLARHGVAATVKRSVANNIDASDVLLNFVADESVDLIVMGAYGHSRMREVILGGMTRDILTHMTVPVLMSH